jgi:hypothetical protein
MNPTSLEKSKSSLFVTKSTAILITASTNEGTATGVAMSTTVLMTLNTDISFSVLRIILPDSDLQLDSGTWIRIRPTTLDYLDYLLNYLKVLKNGA